MTLSCLRSLWLFIALLTLTGCTIDRDRFENVAYSPDIRKVAMLPKLEFLSVEADKTVIMIYTTDKPYRVHAKPGQALQFEDGDEVSSYRIVSASPVKQTVILAQMTYAAGKLQ